MRFLFRELFKRLRIRYIILILVILIFLGYISTFSKSTINMLSNEFPLDKSPNPQATEHFIKSMEYRNYISHIHNFIYYDNFLMRPLFNKMNEEYEKLMKDYLNLKAGNSTNINTKTINETVVEEKTIKSDSKISQEDYEAAMKEIEQISFSSDFSIKEDDEQKAPQALKEFWEK